MIHCVHQRTVNRVEAVIPQLHLLGKKKLGVMTHISLMVGVVLFVISGYGKSFCPDVHFLKALKTF